jgi:thiosulfate reductase cytochrome b subunit
MSMSALQHAAKPKPEVIRRHSRVTRVTHWLNALCVIFLLMSGLNIFMAHPSLYWGQYGADFDKPAFSIGATGTPQHPRGQTTIGDWRIDTTGLLGASWNHGALTAQTFPSWMTLPSWRDLESGRRWHFFFAWVFAINGLIYLIVSILTRHVQRDLAPTKEQIRPSHILHDIAQHARLRFPTGEAAKHYNVLQKLAYLAVIAVLAPLMVLTGLTMSPGFNAIAPIFLDLFGGRQSARTIHFITANLIVLFVLVHLAMVVLAGPLNEIGSMITGRYTVKPDPQKEAKP